MALFKCKMCGGDLEVTPGITVAECEYCGTQQTLPKANEEVIQNLFNRANMLRRKSEFDKAEQIYEKILQENEAEPEAHWGIVLCKYGIEYVEDPKTYKRIPTCHRTSYDAVTADADYLAAVKYADAAQRGIYEAEAKAIDEIQKNILSIVKEEKPFDVFICYKEADEEGKRTVDSAIANEIYYQLTQEGLKVFYAAITLEDKLGREYEPYIFAALNSAKVMLVVGTKPQYFTAVWVKNEWSRFLKLMKTDRSKLLIPCYKDMDAYELPEEFAHLQAQNMAKIGFINDIVRGIKKVTAKDQPMAAAAQEAVISGGSINTAPLLKRAFMFLEDGDWSSADEYCEKVLDIEPENAMAYTGKLMAELQVRQQENLKNCAQPFNGRGNYQKAVRFADETLRDTLAGYIKHINARNENARLEGIYSSARSAMARGTESAYKEAARLLAGIRGYKDSESLAKECYEKAEIARKDAILSSAKAKMATKEAQGYGAAMALLRTVPGWRDADRLIEQCRAGIAAINQEIEDARKNETYYKASQIITKFSDNIGMLEAAVAEFQKIPGWRDAEQQIEVCRELIRDLEEKAEAERLEQERLAELARIEAEKKKKKRKKLLIILAIAAVIAIILTLITVLWIIPSVRYSDALEQMEQGEYTDAREVLESLNGFDASESKLAVIDALGVIDAGAFDEAIQAVLAASEAMNVRYELRGGTAAEGTFFRYTEPEEYTGLLIPEKTGYRFVDWKLSGYRYDKEESLELMLEAVWADDFFITYDLEGGSTKKPTDNPTVYYKDGASVTLVNPEKVGYTFIGWTGTDLSEPTMQVTIPAGSYGNRTFKANWKANRYTVTLDAAGGQVSDSSLTVDYDAACTLPTPTRKSYEFAGWYDGTTKYVSGTWKTLKDVTLTAKWEPVAYQIQYHLDGGTNASGNASSFTVETGKLVLLDPAKTGYKFLGWYKDSEYKEKITEIPAGYQEDVSLYAKWEIATYTITFQANGGAVTGSTAVQFTIKDLPVKIPAVARTNYTFAGWYNGSEKHSADSWNNACNVTLTAKWNPVSYKISYNLSGGTNASGNPGSYTVESGKLTLKNPTKTGYKFLGWYKDSGYKTGITEIAAGASGDVTLYAKWEIITYTITYNANGGTLSGSYKTSFTVNDLPVSLPTPSRTNFVFLGWKQGDMNGADVKNITQCGNITLYAGFMDSYLQMSFHAGNYYRVNKYSGTATTVDIPAYYKGYPVQEIGYSAFSGKTNLTTVNIPNTVKTIESSAFYNCKSLASIKLPSSLTSLGGSVFSGCTALTSITIPDTVTSIGASAFTGCTSLTTVKLPSGLKTMGEDAFEKCTSLKSINIPGTLKEIEYCTFAYCDSLTEVTLNEGLQEISFGAFGCKNLTKLVIPKSVTSIDSDAFDYSFSGKCDKIVFYCKAAAMPSGWESGWNMGRPVLWGYSESMQLPVFTFVTNGGSAVASQKGLEVGTAPETTKAGYMFLGWYNNASCTGDPVTFPYSNQSQPTLYAKWGTESEYYDGSSAERAYRIEVGTTVTVNFTKAGQKIFYRFVPSSTKSYKIKSGEHANAYCYLLNSNDSSLGSDYANNSYSTFQITRTLTAGQEYILRLEQYYSTTGTCTFTIS